jgi:hypothetical protein
VVRIEEQGRQDEERAGSLACGSLEGSGKLARMVHSQDVQLHTYCACHLLEFL